MIKKVIAPVRIDFAGGTTDIEPFASKYGGAVLNAAINKHVKGELYSSEKKVGLSYHAGIPTSSGLGTSGVMNLVWLALISGLKDKTRLAEQVYGLERAMEQTGGKQDQYTSAYGGINFLEFSSSGVKLTKINLNPAFIKELEKRLVLVYTGKPHLATKTNKRMIDNLKSGKNTSNLIKIRDIAWEMKHALHKKNLSRFAELMNLETRERRKLDKSIIPHNIDKMIQIGMKNGAVAAKVCGAGGGGSILFFCNDRKKLIKKFGNKIIEFKFDFQGLRWL